MPRHIDFTAPAPPSSFVPTPAHQPLTNMEPLRGKATPAASPSKAKPMFEANEKRVGRWYFGGTAGALAACCTHPLDLIKVHLQTQQTSKLSMPQMCGKIYRSDGVMGFYNGLTASVLRQLTYTLTRFGVYETIKKQISASNSSPQQMPFYQKVALAGVSGAFGGVVGSPADLINVRMQNDMKLPLEQRRNYKHALDGFFRIMREEGATRLFNGVSMATMRAILMTIGQLAFYDQVKQMMIASGYFGDNTYTHLSSSFFAASMATVLTQPMDVLKTRLMNASPGQFNGIVDCFLYTAKTGPAGFFKGFVPAWIRLAPHTILLFVFLEQMRMRLGYLPEEEKIGGVGGKKE